MTAVLVAVGTLMVLPPPLAAQELSCHTTASAASLARRASPLDSVSFQLGEARVKICYGRPSSRGRTMIGGHHVPYGELWRTGANEPTMIHTTAPIVIGGVRLSAGTVSVYTIPGKEEWTVIFNRSTEQWGDEMSYTEEVKKYEVGRAIVPASKRSSHLEQLTLRVTESRRAPALVLEWEWTTVAIPLAAAY